MSDIKVTWEVDDGYAGSSRPQTFTVDADDFLHCDTDAEIADRLAEYVQEEFEQRVSWSLCREEAIIAAIKAAKVTP